MSFTKAPSVHFRMISASARSRAFRGASALCGAALLLATACEGPSVPDTNAGTLCTTNSECDPGDDCVNGHCRGTSAGPGDAGHPDAGNPPDAGHSDAGSPDAGGPPDAGSPPDAGPVGPGGGTVDLLNFVFTGATRPNTCDSTSTYPAAAFAVILGSMPKFAPQFGLDLGDHMFVCVGAPGETKLQTAQTQMKLYTDALASKWPAGKLWFMTMGNHECNASGAAQVCGTSDPNYVAYYAALTTVSQQQNPNYKLDFNTSQGLVRMVVLADNQATSADVAQADAWLTEADTSAKAVFVAKHHTVEPGSRTGPTWVLSLLDRHRVTAVLVAHDHSYRRSAYPRGGGLGGSVPSVVCGLGAANSSHRGFCRMQQKSDGSFDMIQYDDTGNPGDPLGVWNLKGMQ